MSPNKARFDLRGIPPLSRNILHSWGVEDHGTTGQRTDRKVLCRPTDHRGWLVISTNLRVSASYLNYLADVRNSAKSGWGHTGNRHLRYLVESISMNVGGSQQNVKASSLPRSAKSVGGVRVLGAQESRVQGEGHQEIGAPRSAKVKWEGIPVAYAGRLQVFGAKHLVDASQM